MINLTDSALNAVRSAIAGAVEPVGGLRIMVETGGCAGYKYVIGDMKSHELLAGATIDFVVALEGAGFTFENPNATSSCSCGKSFG